MNGIDDFCTSLNEKKFKSLSLAVSEHYADIQQAKDKKGWDFVYGYVIKNTSEKFSISTLRNTFYRCSKVTKINTYPRNDLKKDKVSIEKQNQSIENQGNDYPIEFDDYSQLTRSTKIVLFKNNLTVADFESIGILNDYDQKNVSKKVRDYITNAKLAEKSKSLIKYQD